MKQSRRTFIATLVAVVMADLKELYYKLFPRPALKTELKSGWEINVHVVDLSSVNKNGNIYLFTDASFLGPHFDTELITRTYEHLPRTRSPFYNPSSQEEDKAKTTFEKQNVSSATSSAET